MLVAKRKNAGIVDHPHRAGCHLQSVSRHCQNRSSRGSSAGYDDVDITRVGADIIKHSNRSIAGTAVAVQNDADGLLMILALSEQLIMKDARGDLVTVPDLLRNPRFVYFCITCP